jgi:hypothetical protein
MKLDWKEIDQLSETPVLHIEGKTRFITKFGAIFTLMVYAIIIILAGLLMNNYYEKRDVNIIYKKEANNITNSLKPDFFIFRFRDINNKLVDPRLAKIVPTQFFFNNSSKPTIIYLETESCSVDKHLHGSKYAELIDFNISEYQCFNNHQFELTFYSTTNQKYYNNYVAQCVNSTENNNWCYPQELIENALKNSNYYLDYYFPDVSIDHGNFTNPIKERIFGFRQRIFYGFTYIYENYFKQLLYRSDNGVVFEDILTMDRYAYDDVLSKFYIAPPGTRMSIPGSYSNFQIFLNSRYADDYKRFYPKLQSVVANIGGIMKLITFVGQIITSFITSKYMYILLSNRIIKTDDDNVKLPIERKMIDENRSDIKINNLTRSSGKNVVFSKVGFFQIFLPCGNNSKRNLLKKCEDVIRKKLSVDQILKNMDELYKVKKLLLNPKQVEKLYEMGNMTIDEHINNINIDDLYSRVMKRNSDQIIKTL